LLHNFGSKPSTNKETAIRVLLINPEFPLSFWTLGETLKQTGRKTLLPPLGLLTVAALLPPSWELRLVDLNTRALTALDWLWADLVMITGMIIQRQGVLNLIHEARERGKITAVGGPYATSLSQEVMEAGVDFLVRGECEDTISHFLSKLELGQRGSIIEADQKPALTASPVPRFDLAAPEDYLAMGIQTSRGCPFDCEFCDIVSLYGRKPRYKDPHQVIAELEALYRLGWRREVFISDDNFIGNPDQARAILTRLIPWMENRGGPFPFWTQTSVNLGQDKEMLDLLTAANFSYVFLGVETPDIAILSSAHKHQNIKNPLGQSLAAINANGLSMVASFVIGFDAEKPGAGDRICEFVEKMSIPVIMLNLLQPLPNTKLWERLKKAQRLLPQQTDRNVHGLQFNYLPSRPQEEILSEYIRATDRLFEPSRYLARVYRYYLNMRPTRRALGLRPGEKKTAPNPTIQEFPSLRRRNHDWVTLIEMIWRQGIRPHYRWQFWRQLLGICRQNPSRLDSYLIACAMGEDLFALREDILLMGRGGLLPAGRQRALGPIV
jgi:radical SAM superfamily enzyme YgiQ (UPF0313 family)